MPILKLELPNLSATQHLGTFLADGLTAGDVIALSGQLGAGKSSLARSIIVSANPNEIDVPSPTFSLVQTYELADKTPLWHLDLFRIENPEDAMQLGLEDAFVDAVCLIEWPDRLKSLLPKSALLIHIYLANDDNSDGIRFADITAPPDWSGRLQAIIAKFS